MYINYLNQDLRVSTDMHEEPKIMDLKVEDTYLADVEADNYVNKLWLAGRRYCRFCKSS